MARKRLPTVNAEPTFAEHHQLSFSEHVTALNWFNYNKEIADLEQYIVNYCGNSPKILAILPQIFRQNRLFARRHGANCRLLAAGCVLPTNAIANLKNDILAESRIIAEQIAEEQARADAEMTRENVFAHLRAELEDQCVDCYNFLVRHNVGKTIVNDVIDLFLPNIGKNYLIRQIVTDCRYYLAERGWATPAEKNEQKVARTRKPRAKRPPSIEKKLKHFRVADGSVDPRKVLGAAEAYLYNSSNNQLVHLVANEGGFDINRSSITNIDESKSVWKRAGRVAAKLVPELESKASKWCAAQFDKISSVAQTHSGRVNDKMTIIRVIK